MMPNEAGMNSATDLSTGTKLQRGIFLEKGLYMKVGYIGLGAMGAPLAQRLIGAYELSVWDINTAAVAEFEKLGADVAPSAAELARRCDVVMLCLPRTENVRQVIFGPEGLAQGLTPGKIIVDQTSGVPDQTRDIASRLAARGVAMVDAPVAGGVAAAHAGKVTIMVSGPDSAYETVSPILEAISSNVFRCGERVGDGQAIKLVNNVMNAACRLATLEIVAMGRKSGLSLATLTDVLNKSTARNRITQTMLPAIVEGRAATNFALPLMVKDVRQAIELGMGAGAPMPVSSITLGLLQTGVNTLGQDARLEDVIKLIESMAGTRLRDDAIPTSVPALTADGAGRDRLTVGYVGLGAMGAALARRLMKFTKVQVFDVRPEIVRELEADGAVAAPDLPSLARDCDVIMICVPDSAVVRQVIFEKGGLVEGLATGKIVVDQTTGDPSATRRMAEELKALGVELVDAPVSGGPSGAEAGTVAIMCSGAPDACASVRPLLESISPNVVYCGGTGYGHIAKLVKNAIGACNRLIAYEAVAMGIKNGLRLRDIEKVINSGSGWSATFERIVPVLAAGGRSATLRLELMVKDLRLACETAMNCGAPMLIANAVRNVVEAAANELGGDANIDELATLFEARAGITFSAS
ncbi:NAD(P)-dependent oxidoreductase [Burkholderia sp. 22088]